jgi:hypothetical protein
MRASRAPLFAVALLLTPGLAAAEPAAGAVATTVGSSSAAAVPPPAPGTPAPEGLSATDKLVEKLAVDHSYSLLELGLGALSLPKKQLCLPTQNRCATADLTLLGSLRFLVRWNDRFALGAGASLGFRPVTDEASINASSGLIERTHTRNYFMLGGTGRYYLITGDFSLWAGAGAGLIVVADHYTLNDSGTAIINPRGVTLRSEGWMIGASLGADWRLTKNWLIGLWTHEMLWSLPDSKACAQTGDCATITGKSFSIETGLSLTYRAKI